MPKTTTGAAKHTKQQPTITAGDEILRLMVFDEPNPTQPRAYLDFQQEFDQFLQTYQEEGWKTVVFDSIDSFELASRKCEQYTMNPKARDPRQWFGGSTDKLEETLCMRLAHLKCNVVIITHIDSDKQSVHGHAIQVPSSGPGRMKRNLVTYFPEVYRAYVIRDDQGRHYQLQTIADQQFSAETHIDAPDPCLHTYDEVTANLQAKMVQGRIMGGRVERFIHVLCYGDFGAGKSTFAATFPKPIKVYMFDPIGGKESPYINLGIPSEYETIEISSGAEITIQRVFELIES